MKVTITEQTANAARKPKTVTTTLIPKGKRQSHFHFDGSCQVLL
jgi:hypothetical protein